MRKFPLAAILHQKTKNIYGIPADDRDWPDSWKTVEFKEYPRMPRFSLLPPGSLQSTFETVVKGRRSRRNFDTKKSLSLQEISSFLFWSAGIGHDKDRPEKSTRFHPSGGARYPLEIYCYFRGNAEIPEGIYHYNIKCHALEQLLGKECREAVRAFPTYPWAYDAPLFLFVTGVFDRTMRKYKEKGYRFVFLDAGALLAHFYLTAEALKLTYCAIGGSFEKEIETLLDLDVPEEMFVIGFVAGHADDTKDSFSRKHMLSPKMAHE